ncbi:MAG: rod shape-determining protein MreD, partial [Streptosporangiaceae bacterium]
MRALIYLVAIAVAVVVQVTVVARIAFPGGAGPDLVLLVVAVLALAGGPMAGVLTGFLAGLALDVAPPGSHFVGQNALVFCLIGYACGLAADTPSSDGVPEQEHAALFEIMVTALGAVCGEALAALLGVMLSDPRVSWPAITHVLPAAAAYDVVLCPFVLYAVAAAVRLAGARGKRSAWSPSPVMTAASGAAQPAVRPAGAGGAPRLRLSDRGKGDG